MLILLGIMAIFPPKYSRRWKLIRIHSCAPGEHEKSISKSLFQWKGIDGTKVLTFRIPPNYNNASDWGGEGLKAKVDGLRVQAENESIPLMGFYGVGGNHGGGPPTKENLRTLDTIINEDDSVGYSDVGRYFSQITTSENLPIVEGDLQFHAIGCYSAYSLIKRLNNSAEHLLMRTEKNDLSTIRGGGQTRRRLL